jgi:cytochrome P450
MVGRMLSDDQEVKWTNEKGIEESRVMEKGTQFLLAIHALHMHPKNFETPEKFNPDRFLLFEESTTGETTTSSTSSSSSSSSSEGQDVQRHPFAFLPFGAGPRRCIGEKLALGEIRTGLYSILPAFRFKLVDGFEPVAKQATTLRAKDGLMVTAHFRD